MQKNRHDQPQLFPWLGLSTHPLVPLPPRETQLLMAESEEMSVEFSRESRSLRGKWQDKQKISLGTGEAEVWMTPVSEIKITELCTDALSR